MANDTLSERDTTFNPLSSHSRSRASFQSSEQVAKIELAVSLLAKAEALSAVTLTDALEDFSALQRHQYHAALDELIVAAHELLDDFLTSARINPTKE